MSGTPLKLSLSNQSDSQRDETTAASHIGKNQVLIVARLARRSKKRRLRSGARPLKMRPPKRSALAGRGQSASNQDSLATRPALLRSRRVILLVLMGAIVGFVCLQPPAASGLMMLATSCLATGCQCSWKSGKFVADCSGQNLTKVPQNDYIDHLLEGAESRMPTLNRDIQALNLSSNQLTRLGSLEFAQRNFRNLQKLQIDHNKLASIRPSAFFKLTGLIELDLSDNELEHLDKSNAGDDLLEIEHVATRNKSGEQQVAKSSDASPRERQTPAGGLAAEAKSFLQHLVQLRSLNLNSNRLKRIEEFALTPLAQLRQLYLSRNQLQFIDKRAFDGLNELNVLHLDGNKLTHLNGEILLRLPQLHALQLAGPGNKWRCDCHLRKLVRLLRQKPSARGAPNLAILQDQPLCEPQRRLLAPSSRGGEPKLATAGAQQQQQQPQSRRRLKRHWLANDLDDGTSQRRDHSNEPHTTTTSAKIKLMSSAGESIRSANSIVGAAGDLWRQVAKNRPTRRAPAQANAQPDDQAGADDGERGGIPWTSLDLDQFECAPELAANHFTSGAQLSSTNSQQQQQQPEVSHSISIKLAARHLESDQPLELTCPMRLVDELDVELTSVEWRYQFQEPANETAGGGHDLARLIWRSNDNQKHNASNGNQNRRDDLDKQRQTIMTMMKLDSGGRTSASDSSMDEPVGANGGRDGAPDWSPTASQSGGAPIGTDKLAIIDYVTRANATRGSKDGRHRASSDAVASGDEHQTSANNETLIRLVHLILGPDAAKLVDGGKPQRVWFLCQVSNSAGRVNLWQPIEFEPPAARGELPSRQQIPVASQLRVGPQLGALIERQVAELEAGPSGSSSGNSSASLERVKSALELELAQLGSNSSEGHSSGLLFLPLSVTPRKLLANIRQKLGQPLAETDSLERSLISANPDQIRPTKSRQATLKAQKNTTRGGATPVNRWPDSPARNFGREIGSSQADQSGGFAADELQRSDLSPLQELALNAIGKFTGGRSSLDEPPSRFNHQGGPLKDEQLDRIGHSELDEKVGERLRELYLTLSAKVVEWARSSRHFTAAVLPHLLAGLIVGCLLTLALLFKLNSCAPHAGDKHHRDTDSRRLPTVKLRRKVASECSARMDDEARRKSNSGSPLDSEELGAKCDEPEDSEEACDELSEPFDDDPARRRQGRQPQGARFEHDDDDEQELSSHYQLELPPPPPSTSSGLELDAGELLERAHRRRVSLDQPVATAAGGSTGSATTTTSGSQRMLLPPRSCALGVGRHRTEFCATPSESSSGGGPSFGHIRQQPLNSCLAGSLSRTIKKSSTLQHFADADNYERLMSAADATTQLVLEPAMTTTTNTWKGANLIAGKSSTLQRLPPTRTLRPGATTTRLGRRRCWEQTGCNAESNNRRTVTWLMSNESVRDGGLSYAGTSAWPAYGEVEATSLSEMLPRFGVQNQRLTGCLSIDNNNNNNSCSSNDLTSYTAELIGARPQLEATLTAQRGASTAGHCWSPSGANSHQAPAGYGRNRQLNLLDVGNELDLVPACLCVEGQSLAFDASGQHRLVARNGGDRVSDSDDSYYLYRPIGPL